MGTVPPRILLVEDDPTLLELTAAILGRSASVDAVRCTADALRNLALHAYDMLVTDLNVQGAGDGLLLAGAMKCLHPQARTVLVTGYPDFSQALLAIQASLDLTLAKPLDLSSMADLTRLLAAKDAGVPRADRVKQSLWRTLEQRQIDILSSWLTQVEADPILSQMHLSPSDRIDHMHRLVEGLAERHTVGGRGLLRPEDRTRAECDSAQLHGATRKEQGYRPYWVSLEITYLRRAIFEIVIQNLLAIDLSTFAHDLLVLNTRLDADLLDSLHAFGLQNGDS